VAAARRCTFEGHPGTSTWGAYQCYGDPAFALGVPNGDERREPPVAPAEVAALAARIAREAPEADPPARARLLAELRAALASMPPAWRQEPALQAAAAEALGALAPRVGSE
jgi:hypothetical protein